MIHTPHREEHSPPMDAPRALLAALLAFAACLAPQGAVGQGGERSGKAVVDAVCVACHGTGARGAPKIGDRVAWGKRASQGLSSLTEHALKGIREMPSHGGNMKLSDLEIARAVAYMVNQSGGRWVEPASAKELALERGGEQTVKAQCAKCHQDGKDGAPKIGDRAAWTPRLKGGLEHAVQSAIRGHGGMPPRGDRADLTDAELRNAVLYMINPGAPSGKGAPAPAARTGALYKSIGGLEVNLGFVPAETLRVFPKESVERSMHGGVPGGSGHYHLNVSLLDTASKAPVADAKVAVRVEQPGMAGETKALEAVVINNAPGYGNYVRMRAKGTYRVTVRIQRADASAPVEATFEHRIY